MTVRLRRNLSFAAALLALLAVGAVLLRSPGWTCGLAFLLALAGVVVLQGERWRSGALLVAAVAVAIGLLDVLAGWLAPTAHGAGIVATTEPRDWTLPDPDLGFRPKPGITVVNTATVDGKTLFHATYTINGDSMRVTPPAPADADTYLFLGDSFMFGHALNDDDTLPAQFARDNDFKVRTVNFSAPGYGTSQVVRGVEMGLLDRLAGRRVKAVVTWIIPDHLARVGGDRDYLGAWPRYVLEDGVPRFTGSFDQYRWSHPLAGLRHLAEQQFPFVHAIVEREREEDEVRLFTALLVRLQALVREKFDAPLLVMYSWPDSSISDRVDGSQADQRVLISVIDGLRQRGLQLMSVEALEKGYDISQLAFNGDGHPTALADRLIAAELKRRLIGP
jgi:hypothetical protein